MLGVILALPCFPLLYLQGRGIYRNLPHLPELSKRRGRTAGASPELSLVALGESTIAGVGALQSEGLVAHLADLLAAHTHRSIAWQVHARSGLRTRQVLEQLVPQLDGQHPDLLLVGVGGNDVFQLNTPFGFERDVHDLIRALRQYCPDSIILFMHMPPVQEFLVWTPLLRFFLGRLGRIFGRQVATAVRPYSGVYFCDTPISLQHFMDRLQRPSIPAEYFSDGVHPSDLTYRLWAESVADVAVHILDAR